MESNINTAYEAPYMKSLAACLNKMVQDGYVEDFKATDRGLTSVHTAKHYFPEEIHVVNFFRFEGNSDPEDNAIMYVIETDDGAKGTIVDAYGAYADENISKIIKQVEDIKKKAHTD